MLGTGDVDYMDPNISYFTIGYLGQRPWIRGLYAYPAIDGKTTSPAPDLATAPPVISNGGKTYTITLRTGAMWNTSPARQVTAADAILGLKRSCNPVQPFGGLPDFESLISRVRAASAAASPKWATPRPRSSRTSTATRSPASRPPGRPSPITWSTRRPTSPTC